MSSYQNRLAWRGRGAAWARATVLGLTLLTLTACAAVLTPPATTVPTLAPTAARGLATPTIAAGIYLTPIPPTPTLTPSPTPTPVVHIVASGDTLLGIALDYGVTVDALVNTNALDAAAFLRIGQALIIPLEEESASADDLLQVAQGNVILPTPTPLPVATMGAALYQTPVDGLWCMGEVLNTTDGAITNLQVEVVLLASDGTPLVTTWALAAADILLPQARAPFSVLFKSPPDGVSDVEVRLLRAEAISPIMAGFVSLTVAGAEGSVSGPQYRVRGTLVNDSAQAVSRVVVVATIYSAVGDVVGYRQLMMAEDAVLDPGAEQPFELLLTPQGVEVPSGFAVIAWGVGGQ